MAAATQNQALAALLFLYREVLGLEFPWLDDLVRAKRPKRLPVVMTQREVLKWVEKRRAAGCSGAEAAPRAVGVAMAVGVSGDPSLIPHRNRSLATPSPPPDRRPEGATPCRPCARLGQARDLPLFPPLLHHPSLPIIL